MPLSNFGSILTFATELEDQDIQFYSAALNNSECAAHKEVLEQFINDHQKNIKNIQRTRRENVTEMILEGINGFTRDPYNMAVENPEKMNGKDVITFAQTLEERAIRYYTDDADKIKALAEVARELKQLAKKRKAHLARLSEIQK